MGVAHVALELGLGHEGGDGIDDDQVDCAAMDEDLRDIECLLAAVRLAHQEVLGLHP